MRTVEELGSFFVYFVELYNVHVPLNYEKLFTDYEFIYNTKQLFPKNTPLIPKNDNSIMMVSTKLNDFK